MHIKTNRLIMLEFVAEDWTAMLAYHRDPRYLQFLPLGRPHGAEVRDFTQMFVDQQA